MCTLKPHLFALPLRMRLDQPATCENPIAASNKNEPDMGRMVDRR